MAATIASQAESGAPPSDGGGRRRAARGVVINSAFLVGLGTLNLVKSLIVVGFVTSTEFGVWSIVVLALYLVAAIKAAAVADKYIQQREPDEERAFQKAFTLELIAAAAATLAMAALAPVLALAYGQDRLLWPALALALVLPGLALQAPIWVFYRRLDFLRQRLLMAVDPLVAFVVTIALAVAGAGYWSLIAGLIAGAWTGGVVAVVASPYRFRLRYERATLREYVSFSWPLMLAVGLGLMIAQLSVFFGDLALGLAGAGAIGLAGTLSAYTDKVDSVVTQALYPLICAVAERRELLLEAFVKSNRLALMWAVPFGVALTLFAGDLIEFGIGAEWRDATALLQVVGLTAAIGHIGFNWGAFYRALGRTRPIAIVSGAALAAFLASAVPLVFTSGLDGFAAGVAIMALVSLLGRWYYLTRLFPAGQMARHAARAIAPTLPAVAAVLGARLVIDGDRTVGLALAELGVYVAVTAIATLLVERRLIREAIGYLQRGEAPGPAPLMVS